MAETRSYVGSKVYTVPAYLNTWTGNVRVMLFEWLNGFRIFQPITLEDKLFLE